MLSPKSLNQAHLFYSKPATPLLTDLDRLLTLATFEPTKLTKLDSL